MKIKTGAATAASILLLTACDSSGPDAPAAAATSAPAVAGSAATGPLLGGACALPITFDMATGWEAKALETAGKTGDLVDMFRAGPFETVCSLDGKPAGTPGFLRIYATDVSIGNDIDHLKVFVTTFSTRSGKATDYDVRDPKYTEITIGGRKGAEATWDRYNTVKKQSSKEIAFTVDTPRGPVVVLAVPMTDKDDAALAPAYELAKKSLTVNP